MQIRSLSEQLQKGKSVSLSLTLFCCFYVDLKGDQVVGVFPLTMFSLIKLEPYLEKPHFAYNARMTFHRTSDPSSLRMKVAARKSQERRNGRENEAIESFIAQPERQ